jgi:hypothetical protein
MEKGPTSRCSADCLVSADIGHEEKNTKLKKIIRIVEPTVERLPLSRETSTVLTRKTRERDTLSL